MSFQCRKAHMLSTAIQCHDCFIVLSHMLLARFLILQRQAKESWLVFSTAIREAEILGLHRLGPWPESTQSETSDAAMKRVIWCHLYSEASFKCLIVGQTPLIHNSFCDTAPPEPLLRTDPDAMHFDLPLILRIRYDLSRLVGKALDLFLSDQHHMDSDAIFALDQQLQAFKHSFPLPYRMDSAGRSSVALAHSSGQLDDDSFRKIILHRYVLHSSVVILQISLHLPHLRRGSQEPGFERSRQAAIEAAVADFDSRQELQDSLDWPEQMATDRFVGGRFSYFHATSTLGICLLSESDVDRVNQLVPLLDKFLEFAADHQKQQGVDPNRCIRQEIGIVSLIHARIRRKFEGSGLGSSRRMRAVDVNPPSTEHTVVSAASHSELSNLDTHAANAEIPQTSLPELGDDMHDWWSWLVSSLNPNTPADVAVEQHTRME